MPRTGKAAPEKQNQQEEEGAVTLSFLQTYVNRDERQVSTRAPVEINTTSALEEL